MAAVEIDEWLRHGGLVVAASERAARALTAGFNRARQAEGLTAWNAPQILDWNAFVRCAWAARSADGRLLLNSTQEQSLWAGIAGADGQLATLLEGPRYRLARMAMEAHELIASYAPQYLRTAARTGWGADAAAFSRWATAFEDKCRAESLLSPARLPLELLSLLEKPDGERRPRLLLAGFDRLLPVQRAVFDAWGEWREAVAGDAAGPVQFHEARDNQEELAACALWCGRRLAEDPRERGSCSILVITQDARQARGQIERAFLRYAAGGLAGQFEFSLGIPLGQVGLPRAAQMLLRWLTGPLSENELDWLISTGYATANAPEKSALEGQMRAVRRRGLERPDWTLASFIQPFARESQGGLPAEWVERMTLAQRRLQEFGAQPRSPVAWAELIPQLLESLHFADADGLSSAEFQAARRWQQAVETAGSLGFDGRRMEWREFLSALGRTLEETLFAAESQDAPILISGPTESAGLTADAVWFLGATEDAWPAGGSAHPLLPPEVQRDARMPHAEPQLDWELAEAVTRRLMASAREVHFSYARQVDGTEARSSRLVAQVAGPAEPLDAESVTSAEPVTITVEDLSRVSHAPGLVSGGAAVLTAQSQCPFKAFATARLGAGGWDPAQASLTPRQRGSLLHYVMHRVWGGPPDGIRTHRDLLDIGDHNSFVSKLVQLVFREKLQASLRERMPAAYLALEQQRLTRLVVAWLEYEAGRVPFEVIETEADRVIPVGELEFNLRLDRLDQLNDGTMLVVDYKTGKVTPKSWEPPRPEDVQLPLYGCYGLKDGEALGGLVFAQMRPGDLAFSGRVGAPEESLFAGLKNGTSLMRNALQGEHVDAWQEEIRRLAEDFLTGKAEVDPRDYPKTCEHCGLQALCRIQEHRMTGADEEDAVEAGDE